MKTGPAALSMSSAVRASALRKAGRIEEALAEINPVFRAALVLREVEDMSYENIAEILEVSIGTVKSRIVRGREALRRNLAARLDPTPSLQLVPTRAAR